MIESISASLEDLRPWMGWAVDWDPVESQRYLLERSENDYGFAIVHEDRAIGMVGLLVPKPHQAWGEIGYWIRTDMGGRGLTTRAVDAVISWAFRDATLHRIELRAGVGNAASNRIAGKLGFSHRGVIRESARGAEGWYDCNLWELLETDERPTL